MPVLVRPRPLALATVVLVLVTAPLLSAAPAQALPVPVDDVFDVYAGATYRLDPLANDETTFLSTGELELCGVTVDAAAAQRVYAEVDDGLLHVETVPGRTGTVPLGYDVCQGEARRSGTVTLDLTRLRPLSARAGGRPGRVVFTNRNDAPTRVTWGSSETGRRAGDRGVPPKASIVVRVTRRTVFWAGYKRHLGAVVEVGDGVVRRVRLPRR